MKTAVLSGRVEVSRISLGTAALGAPYGIPGREATEPPEQQRAIRLLRHAVAEGVSLFDTAPAYGSAERLLGEALGDDPRAAIAGKFRWEGTRRTTHRINESLRALQRERYEVLQVHNASEKLFLRPRFLKFLENLRSGDLAGLVGATVYRPSEALAAIRCGQVDVIQLPLNPFDSRWEGGVLAEATDRGVGVIARSVLLKGVFTRRALDLPVELQPLREGVERLRERLELTWDQVPGVALRWVLGIEGVTTALVGARSQHELDKALEAEKEGPLGVQESSDMRNAYTGPAALVDPRTWPI